MAREVPEDSSEWRNLHSAANTVVTGSEAGVAIGISKYVIPKSLWEVKTGRIDRVDISELDNSNAASVKFGKKLEPQLRKIYEHITGNTVKKIGFIYHKESESIGATPDGIVEHDPDLNDRLVIEIKCPYFREYDYIPPEYMAQIQMQMEVTDCKACDFICYFHKTKTIKIWRVFRSKVYWRWMQELITKFITAVKQDTPPTKEDIPLIGYEAEQLAANDYNFNILNTKQPRRIFPPKCFYQVYYKEGDYTLDKVLEFQRNFVSEGDEDAAHMKTNQFYNRYFEIILFSLFIMLLIVVMASYPSSLVYY